jgi:serine/threonine protein kinase/Tol biopolymer transport system component
MSPESTIAHYRILSKLGEGGMGAVFRATDTKLGRDVAIKVLPDSFAADPDRVARFTREAQVLASLNHPNIAAIYGVEDRALVMELVPGPTLAERIAQGAIPPEEALPIARQIAEALEYAHERGIVHRDLKPANIKVTPEGRVKVLDFGLAKALATGPVAVAADPASSPTVTMSATMAGVIMGTAGYMSPEQAKGKPVDRRADIWAFGVVLAEMLSGRFLYAGETVSETLAAVLLKEPDLSALPPATPGGVRKLLRRCLDKDPQRRLRDIGEARVAIDEILAGATPAEAPLEVPPRAAAPPRRSLLPWTIAGALALSTIGAAWVAWRASRAVERPMMRFSVDLGPDSIPGDFITAVPSPDGTRIVFSVRGPNGTPQLATRPLDQSKATVLAGTDNAEQPFFSPDGQWIGFFAGQQLKKISVHGGAPVLLCAATGPPRGADWGEDGYIIANLDNRRLYRVPATGGTPEAAGTPADHSERTWRFPQVLPRKQWVLFTGTAANIGAGFEDANIEVLSLRTGEVKIVQRGGYFGRYLPSGHLVYLRQGTLVAARFDLDRLEIRGTPVPVLDDVAANSGQGGGQLAFSGAGTFIYRSGRIGANVWELSWLDSSGKTTPVWRAPATFLSPKLSPEGNRIAGSLDGDILVYDPQRAAPARVTFTPAEQKGHCVWSPDGKHIAFSMSSGGPSLWWVRADGSSQPQKLATFTAAKGISSSSFSPDGRSLAFVQSNERGTRDIWTVPLDLKDPEHPRTGSPEPFASSADDPAFSPDSRWIAYTSYEPLGPQVFVRPFPGGPSAGKWQVSIAGRFPVWARNGRELFFLGQDNHLMAAGCEAKGDRFVADQPRRWAPTEIARTANFMSFDVAPDGGRAIAFPVRADGAGTGSLHVTVLLNFFDELKRRMP